MEEKLNELALFSGIGGGILGGLLLGWRTVAAIEIEDYPRRVLLQRQADGILPRFPIWDDIKTFNGHEWRGKVDVISGGFPCQDISQSNTTGTGVKTIAGERSGLWSEMARIVGEVRPKYVFVENVPMLVGRGLTRVVSDLAEIRYDAKWIILGASDLGFNHRRKRIWVLATNDNKKRIQRKSQRQILRESRQLWREDLRSIQDILERSDIPKPLIRRMADGVSNGVDILKGVGNAQVPLVAATAWRILRSL